MYSTDDNTRFDCFSDRHLSDFMAYYVVGQRNSWTGEFELSATDRAAIDCPVGSRRSILRMQEQ